MNASAARAADSQKKIRELTEAHKRELAKAEAAAQHAEAAVKVAAETHERELAALAATHEKA